MELKTKYQYSYFIYPYLVDEKKYSKYILSLLKNKRCKVKLFEREKNSDLYSFFNPTIRKVVFPSLEFNKFQVKKFDEFDEIMQSKILSEGMCTMFEYDLGRDVQGKAGDEGGIFFRIQKIDIMCFNTGICFILIKTNVENSNEFSDLLNFNYKFRDINSKVRNYKDFENINIQTDSLADIKQLGTIIDEITADTKDIKSIDVDTNRFLTYSYSCMEQEVWNQEKNFEQIKNEFYKYSNIVPSNYNSPFDSENVNIYSNWEYKKFGITRNGTVLMTSGIETDNYTIIPQLYENELLYTYMITLYQKLELKRLIKEFNDSNDIIELSKKLIEFTRSLWIKEITRDDMGAELYRKWRENFGLSYFYKDLKNIYEIKYKKANVDKNTGITRLMIFALCGALTFSVVNYLMIMALK